MFEASPQRRDNFHCLLTHRVMMEACRCKNGLIWSKKHTIIHSPPQTFVALPKVSHVFYKSVPQESTRVLQMVHKSVLLKRPTSSTRVSFELVPEESCKGECLARVPFCSLADCCQTVPRQRLPTQPTTSNESSVISSKPRRSFKNTARKQ